MKKLFFIVALLFNVLATTLFAQTAAPTTLVSSKNDTIIVKDAKGYFYQIMSKGKAGVAPGGAYSGNVIIPSAISYKGLKYAVTTVRRGAMWKKPGAMNIGEITKVRLPETVTLVGADAFRGNNSLSDVTYQRGTRIEVRSFWGCPNLKLEKRPVKFAYSTPYYGDESQKPDYKMYADYYYPSDQKDNSVTDYQWVIFKYQHAGVAFNKWVNMDKENALACYTTNTNAIKAGVFTIKNIDNVPEMFKGNFKGSNDVLLAHNNYVATHEFVMFSRHNFDEYEKSMSKAFIQAMSKKYGRKVKYSKVAASALYTSQPEQLVITEFEITNSQAMIVISWVKNGKEICSYIDKRDEISQEAEYSIWNVDDDGNYGIPTIISITKDERGNMEFFFDHMAPESLNLHHLVQKGNKLVLENGEQWYNWVDAPDE